MSRVLVFGDIHIPFMRKGYVEFIKSIYKHYKCDKVVCLGDLFDLHRISRHLPHPDAMGSKEEYMQGIEIAKQLYKEFPNVLACVGNHDARYYKQAAEKNIPEIMLPDWNRWMGCPRGWKWGLNHVVDDVVYQHGSVYSGDYPHVTATNKNRKSTVVGHIHTAAGVHYMASQDDLIFAMVCGCGMDSNSYAAQYAVEYSKKPIVGCGVVLEGKQALFIPMPLGSRIRRV